MARRPDRPDDSERLPSPGAGVAVDILVQLTLREGKGASIRELAATLNAPRSTLHRVLQTLEIKRMVRRDESGYVLGERASEIGLYTRARDIRELAMPVLEQLHAATGETVNLAVPHDNGMLVIAAVESSSPLRMVSAVGTMDELHASALGKSYLAALPPDQAANALRSHAFVRRTPNTITDAETFIAQLGDVAERGYGVDDGESVEGVRCVGVPLFGRNRQPIGALSVSGPAGRMPLDAIEVVAGRLKAAARELSEMLGGEG